MEGRFFLQMIDIERDSKLSISLNAVQMNVWVYKTKAKTSYQLLLPKKLSLLLGVKHLRKT